MSRKHISTRRRLGLEALEDRLCLSSLPVGTSTTPADAASQARLSAAYGQLPLSFEANQGQTDSQVNFLSRGNGYSLFLTPTEAVLSLSQGNTSNVVGMRVVGANPASRAVGLGKQAGVSNYLIGSDPSKWHTDIPNYGQVDYQGVYRGIDLVYHGDQRQLEYDFVVKPGADPRAIRLAFDGVKSASLDRAGNLVLHTSGGDVVEHAPVVYQEVNGRRQAVAGRYVLQGNHQVAFQVGHYDHSKPLVIDPTLSYSTYLGIGFSYAIAVDSSGSAYITGTTNWAKFPTKHPFQAGNAGGEDVFVTKFKADGTALVYSTYLGGSNTDKGTGIAVDPAGNAYVTGVTVSTDFPTSHAAQASFGGGSSDAFVTVLNAAGSALVYSTYLGGSDSESINDHAVSIALSTDASGNTSAYVAGSTTSTNFPTTSGAYQVTYGGGSDAFVTKYGPAGAVVYSSYLGGVGEEDEAFGIAVDGAGNAYLTGRSTSMPTTPGAYQVASAGGTDAFVTKFNASGSGLVYSTYLGGNNLDVGYGIAVDGSGNAYVTGYTQSTNFPTTSGAYQGAFGGGYHDAFVTELNATGTALRYSTYLGGSGQDEGYGIAVDGAGDAYVTGITGSTDFPTKNPFRGQKQGGKGAWDAYVTKITAS
ncbi:MAG: SBBP repeat-containing protein [Isosphaerales bacterium]